MVDPFELKPGTHKTVPTWIEATNFTIQNLGDEQGKLLMKPLFVSAEAHYIGPRQTLNLKKQYYGSPVILTNDGNTTLKISTAEEIKMKLLSSKNINFLFILFLSVTIIDGQTIKRYRVQNPNIVYNSICGTVLSLTLESTSTINDTNFQFSQGNFNLLNSPYRAGNFQMFILGLSFNTVPTQNTYSTNLTLSSTEPGFINETIYIGEVYCHFYQSSEISIKQQGVPIYDETIPGITKIIQLNLNSSVYTSINPTAYSMTCTVDSPVVDCNLARLNTKDLSTFSLILSSRTQAPALQDIFTVSYKITQGSQGRTITIPNLFPHGKLFLFILLFYHLLISLNNPAAPRTTKVDKLEIYPTSGTVYNQDQSLRQVSTNMFLTLTNSNSRVYIPFSSAYPSFKNESTTIYYGAFAMPNNISPGNMPIYITDTSATLINDTYSLTFNKYGFTTILNSSTVSLDQETESSYIVFTYNSSILNNFDQTLTYGSLYYSLKEWYPYSSQNGRYLYNIEVPFYPSTYSLKINSIFNSATNSFMVPPAQVNDDTYQIESVEFIPVSAFTVLLRIRVSANNPIVKIVFGENSLSANNLIDGNSLNGTYELEFFPRSIQDYFIAVYTKNNLNAGFIFYTDTPYNMNGDILPKISLYDNLVSNIMMNITYLEFIPNNLDLSKGGIDIKLYFNLTLVLENFKPQFNLPFYDRNFIGYYNHTLMLYQIDISIPESVTMGELYYYLKFGFVEDNMIPHYNLRSFIGQNATLNISVSNGGDYLSPIINSITAFPSTNITLEPDSISIIGWDFRITDFMNGFVSGQIDVISDLDLLPLVINFNSSDMIPGSGDPLNAVYRIRFQVRGDTVSQTYTFTNIILKDTLGVKTPINSPLMTIYGTPSEQQMKITVIRNNNIVDDRPPILQNITFTPIIDVTTMDRTIEFNIIIIEDVNESGVSTIHTPVIHLSSENANSLKINTQYIGGQGGYYYFNATYQLPFGFGFSNLFVSVYGIVDKYLNYIGYTAMDLKNRNLPYYIKRVSTLTTPIIESSTDITNRGGSLTIYGRSFGLTNNSLTSQIDYQDGKGYQNINVDFHSGIILQYNRIKPINSNFIKFKVINNQISSNEIIIPVIQLYTPPPTSTPTTTPSKCPGTPSCNNNGQCINSICQCYQPWYGPSCSSKNIIVPIPPAYPEPTTGTNITESGSLITTSIEIIGIRELDDINNIVEQFNISNWNFTDQTTPTTNPKYFYSTQINQRSTILNVTIEYFKQSTNITFANQNLFIPQSTIKFTMNLNSYRFKQPTNTLQILMKAAIESDQSDVCSSSGFGSVNGSIQWIKLNVGDQSLYGRFLSDAVIDNTVTPIKNVIIDQDDIDSEQNKQFRSAIVGITIPSYSDSVDLDPDFSNLIDVGSSDTSDFICPKKGLSNGAIAGIVVGVVVFVAIVVGTTMFIIKRKKYRQQEIINMEISSKYLFLIITFFNHLFYIDGISFNFSLGSNPTLMTTFGSCVYEVTLISELNIPLKKSDFVIIDNGFSMTMNNDIIKDGDKQLLSFSGSFPRKPNIDRYNISMNVTRPSDPLFPSGYILTLGEFICNGKSRDI
ncbi:EGF-like domain-containing protein [Heterostelium album PN500]|uniref:EGF-like domain-containing protein n=1 Tax=Heterostelium pallidum (strain ATCC 26659 / Pp 5 / PN500) TaxID=670386 RepID=D3BT86_HETP5|nr:EGF-like domain-containing protein [Heterostelium album PN500]EFA75303.1 EGF-like domain-containing protein [Heterostelium album PN500]|eukprot:XP_020427437.1 EGF-like domain-containing protein [Heterostelium album PN500]